MNHALLEQFIRMIIEADVNPAAANQLLEPGAPKTPQGVKKGGKVDRKEKKKNSQNGQKEESELAEFSGVGAIAGFTAPLGLGSNDLGASSKRGPKKKWF